MSLVSSRVTNCLVMCASCNHWLHTDVTAYNLVLPLTVAATTTWHTCGAQGWLQFQNAVWTCGVADVTEECCTPADHERGQNQNAYYAILKEFLHSRDCKWWVNPCSLCRCDFGHIHYHHEKPWWPPPLPYSHCREVLSNCYLAWYCDSLAA